MHDTIIVVPCYNEAERFQPEPFKALARSDPSVAFVLVDDGSRDETRAILGELAREGGGQFIVLALDQNRGKAEAVRAGVCRAIEQSPRVIGYFDADLATPLDEIAPMRSMFDRDPELMAVLGARVGLLGRNVVRAHHRHYLGRIFATASSFVLGLTVYDTQCGAKMFRNCPAVRQAFAEPFLTRWIFDVEVLARLEAQARHGSIPPLSRSAAEYPLRAWRDVSGSKLRAHSALRAGAELARIWFRYRH
jgi:glycosyltransferase involved in cell wall biosynthesis